MKIKDLNLCPYAIFCETPLNTLTNTNKQDRKYPSNIFREKLVIFNHSNLMHFKVLMGNAVLLLFFSLSVTVS